ncbi:hypothetical protein QZN01_15440 [Burkholderia cenocepacia]|uniref:hypothetical protein n=1 Tax=Burkholderia cenocepacia TaxID=95486 RepID=UPI00264D5D3E|nr:hypothetical protein [Burkholderia cenocepacia]MDN7824038.1 hypothetical protein [Burkholderia cenocepacia]
MASTIGGLGFRAGARDLRLGRRRDPVLRARRRLGRRFGARCREARGGGFDARDTRRGGRVGLRCSWRSP